MMIRKISPHDFSAVSRLLYNMYQDMNKDLAIEEILGEYEEFHQKFLTLPTLAKHHHFVYEENSNIVAYYFLNEVHFPSKVIFDCEMMCYLGIIVVEKSHQNQGIGKLLLNHAKQQSLDLGYQELNLEVFSNSEKNLKFYKKHNFVEYTKHLICDLTEEDND